MPSRHRIVISLVAAALLTAPSAHAQRQFGPDPSRRDPAALSRVIQTYFPTDAAKAAGLRLVELYLENGEFAAAAWVGERLLAHHPGIGDDRSKLLFRTALAEHLAGDDAAAKGNLAQI